LRMGALLIFAGATSVPQLNSFPTLFWVVSIHTMGVGKLNILRVDISGLSLHQQLYGSG